MFFDKNDSNLALPAEGNAATIVVNGPPRAQ
jgi:hypothetical protein